MRADDASAACPGIPDTIGFQKHGNWANAPAQRPMYTFWPLFLPFYCWDRASDVLMVSESAHTTWKLISDQRSLRNEYISRQLVNLAHANKYSASNSYSKLSPFVQSRNHWNSASEMTAMLTSTMQSKGGHQTMFKSILLLGGWSSTLFWPSRPYWLFYSPTNRSIHYF